MHIYFYILFLFLFLIHGVHSTTNPILPSKKGGEGGRVTSSRQSGLANRRHGTWTAIPQAIQRDSKHCQKLCQSKTPFISFSSRFTLAGEK